LFIVPLGAKAEQLTVVGEDGAKISREPIVVWRWPPLPTPHAISALLQAPICGSGDDETLLLGLISWPFRELGGEHNLILFWKEEECAIGKFV
jgi:hypothetical protein